MKMTLNELIRNEAAKNRGRYNLIRSEAKRTLALLHHDICKELVNIADTYNFPMGVLVYIAIGTNAHRPIVFSFGYKKIDTNKALRVIKLCRIFADKFGEKWYSNDKLVHAISRYYDFFNGGNINEYKKLINKIDEKQLSETKIDQAKILAKILFGDTFVYSKGGYIVSKKE